MKNFDSGKPVFGLSNMTTVRTQPDQGYVYADVVAASPAGRDRVWQRAVAQKALGWGPYRLFGKRLFDIIFVLLTLPFSLPIIGICALALWFEGGAPFYTQLRVGRRGRPFRILKLRTMRRDADAVLESYLSSDPALRHEWNELQKLRNDPRITRVGNILRITSMDELPQLLNVLRGDMSVVGPRPMMLNQREMYGDLRDYQALRPGITGLWQISARNSNRFTYRAEVDRTYNRSLTVWQDMRILFKTIDVVLRRTGH